MTQPTVEGERQEADYEVISGVVHLELRLSGFELETEGGTGGRSQFGKEAEQ